MLPDDTEAGSERPSLFLKENSKQKSEAETCGALLKKSKGRFVSGCPKGRGHNEVGEEAFAASVSVRISLRGQSRQRTFSKEGAKEIHREYQQVLRCHLPPSASADTILLTLSALRECFLVFCSAEPWRNRVLPSFSFLFLGNRVFLGHLGDSVG